MHPGPGEPLFEQLQVVIAERRRRGTHQRLRLGDVEGALRCDQRRVDVVVVQVVEPQHPLPQPEVAVQGRQVAVRRLDQLLIDHGRDVRPRERRVQRAVISSGLRLEHVRLDVGVERLPQCGLIGLPHPPEPVEHQPAVVPVPRRPVQRVGCLVQPHLLSGRQRDGRERHVRAGEHRVDTLGPLHDQPDRRDHLFRFVRQRVRLLAQRVADVEGVRVETRLLGKIPLDRLGTDPQQFGRHEGHRLVELGQQGRRQTTPFLRCGHSSVLVRFQKREHIEPRELLLRPGDRIERLPQRGGTLTQTAAVGRERLDSLFEPRLGAVPSLVARIDLAEVPLDLLRLGIINVLGGGGGCRHHQQHGHTGRHGGRWTPGIT